MFQKAANAPLNLGSDNMAIFDRAEPFLTKQYRLGSSTLGVPGTLSKSNARYRSKVTVPGRGKHALALI
jgi:hypothetical protein